MSFVTKREETGERVPGQAADIVAFAALGRAAPAVEAIGADQLPFGERDVHVWRMPLQADDHRLDALVELLSEDERTRMAGFHQEADGRRFACARSALRLLLGHYLGQAPRDLIFTVGKHGKPHLDSAPALEFNLTHSGTLALIALSLRRAVGVDVEWLGRTPIDLAAVADRVLCPPEKAWLAALPQRSHPEAFLQLWACKEAVSKAAGEGFAAGFSYIQTDPAQLSTGEPQELEAVGGRWRLQLLAPGQGYVGALAVAAAPADAG
jgi:4'-phosphopantetheinyl transferase